MLAFAVVGAVTVFGQFGDQQTTGIVAGELQGEDEAGAGPRSIAKAAYDTEMAVPAEALAADAQVNGMSPQFFECSTLECLWEWINKWWSSQNPTRPTSTSAGVPTSKPTQSSTAKPTSTRPTSTQPTQPPATTTSAKPTQTSTSGPAVPTSTKPPVTSTSNPGGGDGDAAWEQQVLQLTNAERAKSGCQPLAVDQRLTTAARLHNKDMRDRGYFSHTSPDGKGPSERARAQGYPSGVGENIAAGYRSPKEVMDGWMSSSGHRANILNCSYKVIGIGALANSGGRGQGPWWTQVFGTRT